jgi:hypothetical protein
MAVSVVSMKTWVPAIAALVVMMPRMVWADAEPRQTETGLVEHWAQSSVVVVLDPSLADLGPDAADAIRAGMGTWVADVPGIPSVVFENASEPVGVKYDGKSVVSAGPITIAGHEQDLAVTITYASDQTGDIIEADIVFNTRYRFAAMASPGTSCSSTYDIGAVATHESGHFFGLSEDWDDHAATMFVTTAACDAHKRVLTAGDTTSIDALYAPPTSMTAHCDAAPSPRSPRWAGIALAFGVFAVTRRMRRDGTRARRSNDTRARGGRDRAVCALVAELGASG